jgi:hypothetical protein
MYKILHSFADGLRNPLLMLTKTAYPFFFDAPLVYKKGGGGIQRGQREQVEPGDRELSDPFDLLMSRQLKVGRTTKSRPHPPLRPKCVGQFVFCARYLLWNTTNTVCTRTNVVHMHCRHGSPVASNATSVAGARYMVDSR